jgi:hypothetical protein
MIESVESAAKSVVVKSVELTMVPIQPIILIVEFVLVVESVVMPISVGGRDSGSEGVESVHEEEKKACKVVCPTSFVLAYLDSRDIFIIHHRPRLFK